ncbi:hypothetical protein [Formosa algae]|uniref:Uncharacterized protein n=1 Tax=Formosa algae TaxID=225843 RepID=A0A9X0YLJ6_9FLAO|nr:hypothetical protein [Formosa algae]MBP1839136.1 hypothetical protein [Formosa algae]MDQ0333913.1 hypothetical protein [Formosa algae]OEI79298.1 hypothetical protein AST99_15100 [Formosa algae]
MKEETKHTKITRKEAVQKMGKYAAFTAIGTFAVLNPLKAQTTSEPVGPGGGGFGTASESETLDTGETSESTTTSESRVGTSQVKSNF